MLFPSTLDHSVSARVFALFSSRASFHYGKFRLETECSSCFLLAELTFVVVLGSTLLSYPPFWNSELLRLPRSTIQLRKMVSLASQHLYYRFDAKQLLQCLMIFACLLIRFKVKHRQFGKTVRKVSFLFSLVCLYAVLDFSNQS